MESGQCPSNTRQPRWNYDLCLTSQKAAIGHTPAIWHINCSLAVAMLPWTLLLQSPTSHGWGRYPCTSHDCTILYDRDITMQPMTLPIHYITLPVMSLHNDVSFKLTYSMKRLVWLRLKLSLYPHFAWVCILRSPSRSEQTDPCIHILMDIRRTPCTTAVDINLIASANFPWKKITWRILHTRAHTHACTFEQARPGQLQERDICSMEWMGEREQRED